KANPDIARAEIIEIVKLRSWATEKQRQLDRGGDRVELRARLHASYEQHVDAGFFIRLQSRDGVGHPGHRHGAGAAHNDKPLVLPAGQSRLHLADTLASR